MSSSSFRPDPYSWKWNANPGSPPRNVSLLVKARILLGGPTLFIGSLLLGFVLCFVWLFGGATLLRDWILFKESDIEKTEGIVISIRDANVELNEQRVYSYHYEFNLNGETYQNQTKSFANRHHVGERVGIEYRTEDPHYSRIINLNTGKEGLWITVPFVFAGIAILGFGIRNRLKGIRLLRDGIPEKAVLLHKTATGSSVNDNPVYKFTFGYTVDNQDYVVTSKTHDLTRFAGEPNLNENASQNNSKEIREPILYDPNTPRVSVLLDSLPGSPRIDSSGNINCNTSRLVLILLAPILVILGHLYWLAQILAP